MLQTQTSSRRAWKRRALSLLLAAVMVLGLFPALPAAQASAHWADPYLSQLMEWGVISQAQSQNPDRALTRADFMGIVNRAYGYHEPGETPFEDIKETDWFYDDVGIAYNARYIKGTSPTTASPNDPLTRETATTILGRNMMLQESAGEILDFTDARRISTWAQGTIKSSLEHYLVSGYDDGTFRPQRNVSWGEMASMVTRLIGTPLQEPGEYSLGGTFGNVTITSPGVTLRDTVVSGDLYITGGVGLGGIQLENVTVLGRIIASGTGTSEGGASILLRNVTADELLVDNLQDNEVSLQADGITEIGRTIVRTSAYIEDNTPEGMGLHMISLEGETYPEGEEPEDWEPPKLTLAGRIEEVVNRTPGSTVHVGSGTVAKLTVDEAAVDSNVIIDRGAVVNELVLDTGVEVTGEGDIKKLVVNAPDCVVEMLPDEIEIRPGITAEIAGEEMDTVAAKESSEEPIILAGYPQAQDVVPTGLDAAFMTNKSGTVYWAVSAITDGSVGEEDLIKPPSYGNIAVRNGSVKIAKGNEETISKVSGLTPGGSYYLSAVLVDARDHRSPVKVISFTTPDNTVPAFCAGYPRMSSVSPTDSIVVTMTNKDCKLYYALLPQGAVAPTADEMKTNAVAGALGYGVRDAKKNVEDTFKVNDQILEEQTAYVLYFFLCDADGVNKSGIIPLPFTTADETPPNFINGTPSVTKVDRSSVTLTITLDEDATVYWVAIPSNTIDYPKPQPGTDFEIAPKDSPYGKLQIENGMNIGADGKSGRATFKGNTPGTLNVSGLKPETAYDFYYIAKDTAGNYTVIWDMMTISPLDESGPKFFQSFSDSSSLDGKSDPHSSTNIYLDVSEDVRYTGEGGGTSFLTLYQAVKNEGTDAARNRLAASLYGAIKLHQIDLYDSSESTANSKWQTTQTGDSWVIDYTQATVEPHEGGIRITFPKAGLHLENGGQYYFTIEKVTDVSSNQNPVVPSRVDFHANEALSKSGGHDVPVFIVEFARVDFSTPGLDKMPIKRDKTGVDPYKRPSGDYAEDDYVRRDMSFRMKPVSTETVANNIRYDLLLWTDSVVQFDLYYRVVDANGDRIDTDGVYPENYTIPNSSQTLSANQTVSKEDYLLTHLGPNNKGTQADVNGWFYLGNSGPMNPTNNTWSGRGVNYFFNGCKSLSFPQLNKFNSNLRYEVIIHLTRMGTLDEYEDNAETWRNWNGEVKFYANVAAGQGDNLENLCGSLTQSNWEAAKKLSLGRGAVSIGRNTTQEDPIDTQPLSRLFTDSRLPQFDGDEPRFTPSPTTVDVDLRFTSPGTLYYVVGKADMGGNEHLPEITTTRTLLAGAGDDREGDDTTLFKMAGTNTYWIRMDDKTVSGSSLAPTDSGASMQEWMIGGIKDDPPATVDNPEKENLIVRPLNQYIFDPSGQSDTAGAVSGNFPFHGNTNETMTIEGLKPETDYFAYFVVKGEADTLSHVYIYHFTTPRATKPKIDLGLYTVSDDSGGATIKTDIDARLNYFVFTLADARNNISILQETITVSAEYAAKNPDLMTGPDTNAMTVLDALLQTYMGEDSARPSTDYGFSVFDVYAQEALKTRMSNFLHGRYLNTFLGTVKPVDRSDSELDMRGNVTKNELLELSRGTDYVILAVSHVPEPNSTVEAEYETYAGYAPLRLGAARPAQVASWSANLQMGKLTDDLYEGAVRITFDSQLYSKEDSKTLLDNATVTDASVTQNWIGVDITKRIDVNVDSSDPRQTTITFRGIGAGKGWRAGDEIYVPGSKFFNANGIACTSNLTIRVSRTSTGMRITLRWDNDRQPQDFDFQYEVTQTTVTAEFICNTTPYRFTGSMGSQTLAVDSSTTAVNVEAKVSPSTLTCQYAWSSNNPNVVTASGSGLSTTLQIKGPGSATITLRIIGTDADGNEIDERRSFDISVAGIELSNATNAGSAQNGSLVWDLANTAGSTLTIRSTQALPANITANNVQISSQGKYFEKSSGQVIFNGPRTEVQIPIVLKGSPSSTSTDTITVTIGTFTCEIPVTFTGSQGPIGGGGTVVTNPFSL